MLYAGNVLPQSFRMISKKTRSFKDLVNPIKVKLKRELNRPSDWIIQVLLFLICTCNIKCTSQKSFSPNLPLIHAHGLTFTEIHVEEHRSDQ